MSYDMHAHRQQTRDWHVQMTRAGAGVHAYALDSAERLAKEDPTLHDGLVEAVEAEIGPEAAKAARRAAKWMER